MQFNSMLIYQLYYFLTQIVYELPTTSQWCFDVSWCPRNPGVISTASFDGHVTVSSVMGGGAAHDDVPDKVVCLSYTLELHFGRFWQFETVSFFSS